MPADSTSRDILVRGLPRHLADGLELAAADIGISQAAVAKMALWSWLAERGYVVPPPVARGGWVVEDVPPPSPVAD